MKIFVLNAGSSTYKGSIFDLDGQQTPFSKDPLWKGILDYGYSPSEIHIKAAAGSSPPIERTCPKKDLAASVRAFVETSWTGSTQAINSPDEIAFVGHRIVHGGEKFQAPTIINEDVKKAIRDLYPLAPLHNPANLEGIEILQSLFPHVPHLGVFDTAFHMHLPEYAFTYALPYEFKLQGIRRYGFHGISHEYCSKRAAEMLNKELQDLKIVTCHLGNGSSLAAIKNGYSIDTTMGFTPLEGIIMGTRCGSIDPGILLYLLREKKQNAQQLDHCLNNESGLKGISGDSDMREIMEKRAKGAPPAQLAFDMLVHSLVKNIGAMIGVLGGIDVLAFTGGIGENLPELREKACSYLEFAGIHMDEKKNKNPTLDADISLPGSKAKILVIEAREDLAIAWACLKYKLI
jgi:acetate kinase